LEKSLNVIERLLLRNIGMFPRNIIIIESQFIFAKASSAEHRISSCAQTRVFTLEKHHQRNIENNTKEGTNIFSVHDFLVASEND